MTPEQLSKKYATAIRVAVRQFGEYSFDDKGPQEVMDLPISEIKALSVDDAAETLRLVLEKDKKHGPRFIGAVLVDMQEWDHFDELLEKHKWLGDYY